MAMQIPATSGSNFIPDYLLQTFAQKCKETVKAETSVESPFKSSNQTLLLITNSVVAKILDARETAPNERIRLPFASDSECTISCMGSNGRLVELLSHREDKDNLAEISRLSLRMERFSFDPDSAVAVRICFENIKKIRAVFQRYDLPLPPTRVLVALPELLTCYYDPTDYWIKIGFSDTTVILSHPLTANRDFIAHAIGLQVIQMIGMRKQMSEHEFLGKIGQSRALREHLADVLTIVAKHLIAQEEGSTDVDWSIGTRMLKGDLATGPFHLRCMDAPGTAYRELVQHFSKLPEEINLTDSNPAIRQLCTRLCQGTDPQPDSMKFYADIIFDNGGEHIFSGILNRAFYLFVTSIKEPSYGVPAIIWVRALYKIGRESDFQSFAEITLKEAAIAVEEGALQKAHLSALFHAWHNVGIRISSIDSSSAVDEEEPEIVEMRISSIDSSSAVDEEEPEIRRCCLS